MGKPKPGLEARFIELFELIEKDNFPKPSLLDLVRGKKYPTKEDLLQEWFALQTTSYETIKAPRVGRDKEADEWVRAKYEELGPDLKLEEFLYQHDGFYVIELSEKMDGVPVYTALGQDENVFRGQLLTDCVDLLGEELVREAWETKLALATLDYGNRIMSQVDPSARAKGLGHLKEQRLPPDADQSSLDSQIHIAYSLAKWLIFYGQNGHGYEADF